jgi:hypothetical protein
MYPKEIVPEGNEVLKKGMAGYSENCQAKCREKCKKEPNRPVRLKHAGFGSERLKADREGQTPGVGLRSNANPWPSTT